MCLSICQCGSDMFFQRILRISAELHEQLPAYDISLVKYHIVISLPLADLMINWNCINES